MHNRLRFGLGFCGWVVICAVVLAKDEVARPHWLSENQIKAIVQEENPPPAAGSPADQADLQADLAAQNTRTPAQIAEAQTDASYSVNLFSADMGRNITSANYPVTYRFFERFNKQVGGIVGDLKDKWKRPRPYEAHPEIHPLFGAGGYSYPSGHALHSFAFAVILGQLFPDKAAAFLERARKIAQSRVDAGVHYPTDIKEGERAGREVAHDLLATPAFMDELKAAQTELAGKK